MKIKSFCLFLFWVILLSPSLQSQVLSSEIDAFLLGINAGDFFENQLDEIELKEMDLADSLLFRKKRKTYYKSLGIAKGTLSTSDTLLKSQVRWIVRGTNIVAGFTKRKGKISTGIRFSPPKSGFDFVLGDYHIGFGFGTLFTSKLGINSWSQAPMSQLPKYKKTSIHTGSDTLRYLRGGGINYQHRNYQGQFFFSSADVAMEKSEIYGCFQHYKSSSFQAGIGWVRLGEGQLPVDRVGGYFRYRFMGLNGFGEISHASHGGWAYHFGFLFFGSENHEYIMQIKHQNAAYFQVYTAGYRSLSEYSKIKEISLCHLWSITRDIQLQVQYFSKARGGATTFELPEESSFGLKMFLSLHRGRDRSALIKGLLTNEKNTFQARFRQKLGLNSHGQLEFGYGIKARISEFGGGHSYVSFSVKHDIFRQRLAVNLGLCLSHGGTDGALLYRYEPDVYYGMSLPVISSSGARGYFLLKYSLTEQTKLEVKISRSLKYRIEPALPQNQVAIQLVTRPSFTLTDR